jgi:hypothetical protein
MEADNFFYGLQAILSGIVDALRVALTFKLFWGFVLGFLVSTIVHAFLVADNVKHLPTMMFNDTSVSFQKIYPRAQDTPYEHSFALYAKNVDRLKSVFYSASTVIVIVLMFLSLTLK